MADGERLTPRRVVGLLVGFGGIVALVWPEHRARRGGPRISRRRRRGADRVRRMGDRVDLRAAPRARGQRAGRGRVRDAVRRRCSCSPPAWSTASGAIWSFNPRTSAALAYLIFFGAIAGFSAYAYALKHLPVATVSLYAYINPVIAVVLGHARARRAVQHADGDLGGGGAGGRGDGAGDVKLQIADFRLQIDSCRLMRRIGAALAGVMAAAPARAQEPTPPTATTRASVAADTAKFFGGAALALGMHESGHLRARRRVRREPDDQGRPLRAVSLLRRRAPSRPAAASGVRDFVGRASGCRRRPTSGCSPGIPISGTSTRRS